MPTDCLGPGFSKLGEQYGPLTWMVIPGRNILLLNDYQAMRELLDKRGGNTIDRPRLVMFAELVASARRYLESLAREPKAFDKTLHRILGETITELSFGAHNDGKGNDYVDKHETLVGFSKKAVAGYVVDLFPPLRFIPSWFPFAQFKRDAKIWKAYAESVRKLMFEGVQQRMAAGGFRSCYVLNSLEALRKLQASGVDVSDDEKAVMDSGFSFYQGKSNIAHTPLPRIVNNFDHFIIHTPSWEKNTGGVDTTQYTLKNFLLAMSLYPSVQSRAREEIDRIIGTGRCPDFTDQAHLPYVHAILLESLRWNPPAPAGFPHMSREDDTYNGYFIPKGTMILKNMWGVSRNPTIYSDPCSFNPDRFIDDPDILDPREWIFGFGRRSCPGMNMALQLSWIFIVSILWGYEIKRPEGETAFEDDADMFDFDFLSSPKPFRCDFIPREDTAEVLFDE
ncbi:hypothetical protein FRC05_003371 [Tulasnella sp. 425]|nr:hypothetical protein FRC05_003371 [Tulasnella sp. 425]